VPEQITRSIIVKGDINEIFRLWMDFENFPRFMAHIKSVTKMNDTTSRWVMEGPGGKDIEWESKITTLEEPTRIAWNGEGNDIKTTGQVTFNQLTEEETEVNVMLQYVPLGGFIADIAAELFADPEGDLEEDLRNFKAYAENRAYMLPKKS